jgi:hypothetical protein
MGDELFEIVTTGGTRILPGGTILKYALPDGTYVDAPVREASRYAGRSQTIFETSKIDAEPSKLVEALMSVEDGPLAQYRLAKFRLFVSKDDKLVLDGEGNQIPVFAHVLRSAAPSMSQTAFLDDVYESVAADAQDHGITPVKRNSLDEWYRGGVVAPHDWNMFRALARARESYPELEKLVKFYEDFKNYVPDPSKNDVQNNLFFAHRYLWGVNVIFGKATKNGMGNGHSRSKTERCDKPRQVDSDGIKDFLLKQFGDQIDRTHSAVSVLSVKKIKTEHTGNSYGGAAVPMPTKTGLYIVKPDSAPLQVPTKSPDDAARDVVLVERVLMSQPEAFVVEHAGNKGMSVSMTAYVMAKMFELMRHSQIEKSHLLLSPQEQDAANEFGREMYRRFFKTEEGNQFKGVSQGALQRLLYVRDALVPFFPKAIERFTVAKGNLGSLLAINPKHMRTNGARKELQRKIREAKETIAKYEADARREQERIGLKVILTEHNDEVMGRGPRIMTTDIVAEAWKKAFDQGAVIKKPFYVEDDFVRVLTQYGLQEFINRDFNISVLRKIKELGVTPAFMPSILQQPPKN